MKTRYITALTLMLFAAMSFAQQTQTTTDEDPAGQSRAAKHKIVLGAKAGVNRANVYDREGDGFVADSKIGFAGGIFLALPLTSFWGFQPELMFSQKGFQGSGMLLGEPYSVTRTTNYLDVPLQLQIKPFRFLSVYGGVTYSYLLSQSDKFSLGPNNIEQKQQFENDNIRKNIFGVITGLDLNIRHIVLSGRAGWDLTANHGDGTSSTPRYKNVSVQATLGYRIY